MELNKLKRIDRVRTLHIEKILFFILLLTNVGLTSQAGAASLERVMEKGVLEVAVYKNFPPYSYTEKGKQLGIDIDLAKELASRMSLKASIRMVGADENMDDDLRNNIWKGHYLGGGTADVMFHVPHDRKYAAMVDQVNFISPYQLERLVFAFNKAKLGDAPTIANFTHDPIGVELDTLSDFYLLRAVNGKVAEKIKHYKSITEAVAALNKGEVVAVMGPKGEIEGALATSAITTKTTNNIVVSRLVTPGLSQTHWALGLAVKASYPKLAGEIDTQMVSMVKDGAIKTIFEKYGVTYAAPSIAPEKQKVTQN